MDDVLAWQLITDHELSNDEGDFWESIEEYTLESVDGRNAIYHDVYRDLGSLEYWKIRYVVNADTGIEKILSFRPVVQKEKTVVYYD